MNNPFLINLAIAVFAWVLFHAFIDTLVKDAKANERFNIILIIACVLYAMFGTFLPFR